jgi:hypothetical protein
MMFSHGYLISICFTFFSTVSGEQERSRKRASYKSLRQQHKRARQIHILKGIVNTARLTGHNEQSTNHVHYSTHTPPYIQDSL